MDHQLEVMEMPVLLQHQNISTKIRSQFCNTLYTTTTLNQTLYATVPAYDPNLEEWNINSQVIVRGLL